MDSVTSTGFGYSYIPGVEQYSAGVIADEGMEVRRVRLGGTPLLEEAFDLVEEFLAARGLSARALCAFEMRAPRQFDEAGFASFNRHYIGRLRGWGIMDEDGQNPVARSTVVPYRNRLGGPCVHAFCYVAPTDHAESTYALAGSGEVPEGNASYRDHIVALGDTSPAGLAAKGEWVVAEMGRRLEALGHDWTSATDVHVYTAHDFSHVMSSAIAPRLLPATNVTWHLSQPPIQGLAFEMDCRRVRHDSVLLDRGAPR